MLQRLISGCIAVSMLSSQALAMSEFQHFSITSAQVEKVQGNIRYWQSVFPSEFAQERLRSLQTELARKQAELGESRQALSKDELAVAGRRVDELAALQAQVADARARAEQSALGLRNSGSYWSGPTYLSPFLTAEYVLCLKVLGRLDPDTASKASHYLERIQKVDGSFGAWDTGPTDATITHGAMMALKVIGTEDSLQASARAQEWITRNHAEGQTLFTVHLMAAMLGLESIGFNPAVLDVWYLRDIPKYGLNDWASWIRALAVPLGIVLGIHGNPKLNLVEKHALKELVQWLVQMTDPGGQLYISETTNTMGILAYHELTLNGFGDYTAQIEGGLAFIRKNLLEERQVGGKDELVIKNPPSVNWDTPNFLMAALGDGSDASHVIQYGSSFDFLYRAQVLDEEGEWKKRSPHTLSGGWGTVPENRRFPDADGTGQVLEALRLAGRTDDASVSQNIRGLQWLLGLQGPEGGWATFERSSTAKHPGAMRYQFPTERARQIEGGSKRPLKMIWDMLGLLRDVKNDMVLLVDYPFADMTGHVLDGLSAFGFSEQDKPVQSALDFIRKDLGAQPVWFSRYGIDYFWGTEAALRAFMSAGADMRQDFLETAVNWVLAHQNPDGGFGQSMDSLQDFSKAGSSSYSIPSQTALALIAMLASGRALTQEAERAARFLIQTQNAAGSWTEENPNCWAGGIYTVDYTYLPRYLSMLALTRYQQELARAAKLTVVNSGS